MRYVVALIAVSVCWAASGCASGMVRPTALAKADSAPRRSSAAKRAAPIARAAPAASLKQVAVSLNAPSSDSAAAPAAIPAVDDSNQPDAVLAAYAEEVVTPRPNALDTVTSADDISDPDALTRRVEDVPVDIRPPQGELPTDLAAAAFAESAAADQELASRPRPEMVVGWTPWTLCFRPLYLEDIALERYGCSAGCLQTPISAGRFFFGVGLMPYKMAAQLPRSCVCSNGFSRCGDAPLPGYAQCQFSTAGAAFEAATLLAIVLSLP